ncbi:MAG: heme-copper oxidase subunit III [Anaerolineae bacterium]|nr:heme-copper oxidase subunit III [Anaerolineae bacterium]
MTDTTLEQGHDAHAAHDHFTPAQRADNWKTAVWLYLGSEVVLFSVLIAMFILFRLEFPERIHEVHEAAGVFLVAVNTFLLLASSWAMVMGLHESRKGNPQGLIRWISLTALLGAVFVGLQYVEYQTLAHEGITLYSDSFGMRFYAPTAFHGAHVIVGVVWALLVANHARRGGYRQSSLGVEIFGLYWHFVDVVWIVLFTVIYLI